MGTAESAEQILGDKLYQQRARAALPLLVRQALAGTPITYEDLAEELEMPNPRNLNFVLGSVGKAVQMLAAEWGEEIPPIQCLVMNKSTGLPGEGIGWFIKDLKNYESMSKPQKKAVIKARLSSVYAYENWLGVLRHFNLKPQNTNFSSVLARASRAAGGEGAEHKRLKEYVARHPEVLGVGHINTAGETEHALPSGDSIDVYFSRRAEEIGVEVKPSSSDEADIIRGMYQCIKYKAVLEARQAAGLKARNARTLLVLGGNLPKHLLALRNLLGIEIVENITAKDG